MRHFFIRILAPALCCALLVTVLGSCGPLQGAAASKAPSGAETAALSAGASLRALVLYDGALSDGSWEDVYSRLAQPLLLNLDAACADISETPDYSGFDLIYPDKSLAGSADRAEIRDGLMDYVENGGSLFLTNEFYDFFPAEFIGAAGFEKIDGCPTDLTFPQVGDDLGELQTILSDFAGLYAQFADYPELSRYDYGYGATVSSATPIVTCGSLALYTMNRYGGGYVFFTNPLLPNPYAITGFSLEPRNEAQTSLSNTTASCNQLLENAFASYISKQRWGYSLYRVFGSFGRPSMAWELHTEEITGLENGSGIVFGELCKEYDQVPSYTFIRSAYEWFLRAESVTYLLGNSDSELSYGMDFYENAYSSGTHVVSDGLWLSLARVENAGSYFIDYDSYDQRAYPSPADVDGDGNLDIVCGSSDGRFYSYDGLGFTDHLRTGAAKALRDASGRELLVQGYSAPALFDVNGDGRLDMVSGCMDGRVYWFSGNGDGTFEYEGLACNCLMESQTLPDVGDLDSDGCLDLVVGSNSGRLSVWYGSSPDRLTVNEETPVTVPEALGSWLSPRIADLDGSGKNGLAIGTRDGYVARLVPGGSRVFVHDGYITLDERNYKGNYNAKFGNNCVPAFADLNGDGKTDLLAGCLEYGMAYPIDSEYFPCADALAQEIDYILDNGFYLGLHFYTNRFASPQREKQELEYHMAALQHYGVPTDFIGTNQHTWYTSGLSQTQSLLSAWDAGLLWNSGFSPANNKHTAPQISPQNVIALPFFLIRDGARTILMQNCATLLYLDGGASGISAKYGMPVCIYYHCDFAAGDEAAARQDIEAAETFRRNYAYNFTGEHQLMTATAVAYNLGVFIEPAENGAIRISPRTLADDFALYDERYQNACGVRLSAGEALAGAALSVDADVWYAQGNDLYFSLNRPVLVSVGPREAETHIRQINIAAEVEGRPGGCAIRFLDGGMMQVTVDGEAATGSTGWRTQSYDGLTVFTKYGQADTIEIEYD